MTQHVGYRILRHMDYVCVCRLSEELLRCQEEVHRLQVALSSTRTKCSSVSEERLGLQQENQQLHKDMDTLRKECAAAQKHSKLQVHTHSLITTFCK